MVCNVRSLGLHGVTGYEVSAECDLSGGLPAFTVVGLPDAAVNEARERVRAAIKNCGFTFPVSRITVNLAPAHLRKAGTLYDLPMLVGILCAGGQLRLPDRDCAFVGELSLSGQVRPCAGMLPMALAAKRAGIKALYVPADNEQLPAYLASQGCGNCALIVMGEDETSHSGVFEMEALVQEGESVGIGLYCGRVAPQGHPFNDPENFPWNARSVTPVRWVIENGVSSFAEGLGMRAVRVAPSVPTQLRYGTYNRLRMESDGEKIKCYVNDVLTAELDVPHYPALRAVALEDENSVIVKIVNISRKDEDVRLCFDCDLAADYTAEVLTGSPDVRNTLEEPDAVHDVQLKLSGAARSFTHHVPACSASVLLLRKQ